MARMKYTDPRRRRAQPAQNVVPVDIEVIELSDDSLHDGEGVEATELLDDTAHNVDVAEGIEVPVDTMAHEEELEVFEQPDDIVHDEEGLGVVGVAVHMPSESDESLGFRDKLSPYQEANVRAMAIVVAGRTTEVQNQDLDVDDSWFNELPTQPQSPSLPSGFRVEQHEHAPLHAHMLDEEEEEEKEIPLPNQIEEGDIAAPLQMTLSNEEQILALDSFVDKFLSDICDEVVDENEEDEPLREALATEGERLGEELATEHVPNEELTRENDEEQMLQEAEHVLEHIAEVYAPISEPSTQEPAYVLEPPIQELTHVPEPTAEEAQPPPQNRQQRDTLRYLYEALTPTSFRPCDHLQIFRPTVSQLADDRELGDVNNPQHMDVNAACFFYVKSRFAFVVRSHNTTRQS